MHNGFVSSTANVSFFQREKFIYGMFKKMSRRIGPITDSSSIFFIVSVQELKAVSIFGPSSIISYVTSIVFSMTICQKQKHVKYLR